MPTGSRPLSDTGPAPVDVGSAADPVAAVLAAHEAGRRIALRTSGTTGRPRAVVRTTESWVASFGHVAMLTGLERRSRLWLPGPLTATLNLFAATLARHVGAEVVDRPEDATHSHLTPAALQRTLDDGLRVDGLHLTVAGDRLPSRTRVDAEAAGATVSHYYGAAELSFVAWGSDEHDLKAFPEVELAVRDGEVWVRSPYLCEGYDGDPGPLRRDSDGFATVGDRGVLTGGLLRVTGRGGEAVVTAGATVLPSDVEAALAPGLRGTVVVVGLPHLALGQVVAAALTDPEDLTSAHADAVRTLAPAQRPRRWFQIDEPPMTDAGKVDRVALAHRLAGPDAVRLVPRRSPSSPREG